MQYRKFTKPRVFAYALILMAIQAVFAIRVSPGIITIRGIPVGVDTSLDFPLSCYNDTDDTLVYSIRVIKPSQVKERWRDGYEGIPDTTWLYLEDGNELLALPNSKAKSMVRINIPDSDVYYNQMWAVYMLVTPEKTGMFTAAVAPLFMLETEVLPNPEVPPAGIPGIAPAAITLRNDSTKASVMLYNTTDSILSLTLSTYIPDTEKGSAEIEATGNWYFDEDFKNGFSISQEIVEIPPNDKVILMISTDYFPTKRCQALIRIEGAPVVRFIRVFFSPI